MLPVHPEVQLSITIQMIFDLVSNTVQDLSPLIKQVKVSLRKNSHVLHNELTIKMSFSAGMYFYLLLFSCVIHSEKYFYCFPSAGEIRVLFFFFFKKISLLLHKCVALNQSLNFFTRYNEGVLPGLKDFANVGKKKASNVDCMSLRKKCSFPLISRQRLS